MVNPQKIQKAVHAMSEEERLVLGHQVISSIHKKNARVEQVLVEEVRRRCDEIDRGDVELLPAEEVFEEARRVLASR